MTESVNIIFLEKQGYIQVFSMDKNHNSVMKRAGRPRLENNPLREYWRAQKNKQRQESSNET